MFNFILDTMLTCDIGASLAIGRRIAANAGTEDLTEAEHTTFCQALTVLECMDRERAPYRDYVNYTLQTCSRKELAASYLKKVFKAENEAILDRAIVWYDSVKNAK